MSGKHANEHGGKFVRNRLTPESIRPENAVPRTNPCVHVQRNMVAGKGSIRWR